MLEANDHFSDKGKGIILYSAGEGNGKLFVYFFQGNHMNRKYKLIDDIVQYDWLLKSDGT